MLQEGGSVQVSKQNRSGETGMGTGTRPSDLSRTVLAAETGKCRFLFPTVDRTSLKKIFKFLSRQGNFTGPTSIRCLMLIMGCVPSQVLYSNCIAHEVAAYFLSI